jgi:hypothetical protein
MCVTSAPARLASTIVFANRGTREGKPVHVLGYQNSAQNQAAGPNSMLLPIPSAAPMGPENMVDTRMFGSFLSDYAAALRPRTRGVTRGGGERSPTLSSVQVFERGSYTVVLARNADAAEITAALESVPPGKRPTISAELLDAYSTVYPGWHLALCCFDGSVGSEPLLWWYEPAFAELFLPGLDAHDGRAPRLDAHVVVDHSLIVGASSHRREVGYSTVPVPRGVTRGVSDESIRGLFPSMITGIVDLRRAIPNGDWWADQAGRIERKLVAGRAIG